MARELDRDIPLPGGTIRLRFSGHSDRGAVRTLNEDSFITAFPVFAVADGMGGHSFGDKASQAAITVFAEGLEAGKPAVPPAVLETVAKANDSVLRLSDDPDAISGTTLTGVAFVDLGDDNYHWMAFNVGDSRTYLWDGRKLGQLSVDHSVVQELMDRGMISSAEAEKHPDRNIVTRALGAERSVDPDVWLLPARKRQTFLLCSDGLTRELDDAEIARIIVFHDTEALREPDNLRLSLAERLVHAAIAAGGSDNVTVVIVECELIGAELDVPGVETLDRAESSSLLEDTRPRG